MKKPNQTTQHRKLVFQSEAIAALTTPRLKQVAGGVDDGCSRWGTCPPDDGLIG
ncbi:MAG TPA: class I lanthipeptide [Kofleriaceae bacterium]|nr:class I lanthipeptide [Kofleriaceae bacterium]